MSIFQETVDTFHSIQQRAATDKRLENSIELGEGVYTFISFDLINSTLFKSRHMDLWPGFISAFYESVASEFGVMLYREKPRSIPNFRQQEYIQMIEKTGGFKLWKLVGDEVLLYHKTVSKEELYNTVLYVDYARKELIEDAITIYLDKKYPKNCEETPPEKAEQLELLRNNCKHLFLQYFEVKTTIWIGSCANDANRVSLEKPNLLYDSTNFNNENTKALSQPDFLGPDIDEGFRLCECSEKRQMVVSPKLVYLLLLANGNDIDRVNSLSLNFRIVNYVSMKGVWEERLYPIIMFCQTNMETGFSIKSWKEKFEYDAFETSYLYKNIDKYGEMFLQDKKFSVLNLKNIYEHVFRDEEMKAMLKVFQEQEAEIAKQKDSDRIFRGLEKRFEFHISCLCYDQNTKKYWITEHPNHGWSFGCIQVKQNKEYYTYVAEEYETKYGLHISLDDNSPILSFYSADRPPVNNGSILGVIVLVDYIPDSALHESIDGRWVSYDELHTIKGKKITNFDSALERANEIILKRAVLSPS